MTGSLQIKKDKYYMVINITDASGKRKPRWISTGLPAKGNKKRAERMLREYLREYECQETVTPTEQILFSDWISKWLSETSKRVDAVTFAQYRKTAQSHVIPYFKAQGLRLDEITRETLQTFMDQKRSHGRKDGTSGLSPVSLRHFRNILSQSLKAAVRNGLISANLCDGVILPKKEQREVNSTRQSS